MYRPRFRYISLQLGSKILVGLMVLTSLLSAGVAAAGPAAASEQSDFLVQVNQLRANNNVAALQSDPNLSSVAQQWSDHLAVTGVLQHNSNRPSNTAEVAGEGPSVQVVLNALYADPPHRQIMMDPQYGITGVGISHRSDGTVWIVEDFQAGPPAAAPTFISPVNGATGVITPGVISWHAVTGIDKYWLFVGYTLGDASLINSGALPTTQTSYPLPAVPVGTTLWARIYSHYPNGWAFNDIHFQTGAAAPMYPTNGATGVTTPHLFTWNATAGADFYWINIGTYRGVNNLVDSGAIYATHPSYQVPALPAGRTLWAREYSHSSAGWVWQDISFTTAP